MSASVKPAVEWGIRAVESGKMLSCELIDDFSRLEALSADWDRLWRADPQAELFQSFAWARAWWQAYRNRFTLCVLCVSDGKRVIGIVPLVRQGDTIVFLSQRQSDYCDILCEENRTEEVLAICFEKLFQLPGWKNCLLRNLKPEGQLLRHWRALPPKIRRRLQVFPGEDCKTILLDKDRSILPSLIQKDHTRRRLNKLRKAGSLTFRHIENRAEAQQQLDYFFQHHVRRHALTGKRSFAESPELRQFLRTLVEELDLTNTLRFGVLELDGRPLAWHLSFQVNGKLAFYQQTFDVEAWDYAPGEVLVHQLLVYAQNHIEREFDFTRGDEPFKARFTTHIRKTYSMHVDRPDLRGKARHFARAGALPLIGFGRSTRSLIKHYPKVFHAYRSARLWLSGSLARIRQDRSGLHGVARECLRIVHLDSRELEVFVAPRGKLCVAASNPGMVAREGQFGDVVDISHEHPGIATAFELPEYRQRFKAGDRFYAIWHGDKFVLGAWASTRRPAEILSVLPGSSFLEEGRHLVAYDCWSVSPDAQDHWKELFGLLSNAAAEKKLSLAICCPVTFPTRAELAQQGFELRYRLLGSRISHRFQAKALVADAGSDAVQAQPVPSFENHLQGSNS